MSSIRVAFSHDPFNSLSLTACRLKWHNSQIDPTLNGDKKKVVHVKKLCIEVCIKKVVYPGTLWIVDWKNYSKIYHMLALIVSKRASGLMFQCHKTFYLEVGQTHPPAPPGYATENNILIHMRQNIIVHFDTLCNAIFYNIFDTLCNAILY